MRKKITYATQCTWVVLSAFKTRLMRLWSYKSTVLPLLSEGVLTDSISKASILILALLISLQGFAQSCPGAAVTFTSSTSWTVPAGGPFKIRITAKGAQGGGNGEGVGGKGATMSGDFIVASNQMLDIIAGAKGADVSFSSGADGGGGSGVRIGTDYLIMAGGGGGRGFGSTPGSGLITTAGGNGGNSGGTDGNGGMGGSSFSLGGNVVGSGGGGGGGVFSVGGAGMGDGNPSGGAGGSIGGGGGGPGSGGGHGSGGGGGGYSGGGGGNALGTDGSRSGGGGGSLNTGSNQANTEGDNSGGGSVIIECLGAVSELPVELTSFRAYPTASGNHLTWETASEQNTQGFEIEKSSDGKGFESIGKVAAVGNSSTLQSYNFVDKIPFSVTYYRLKINDFDGTMEYSKVVSIQTSRKTGLKIYPSVATDFLTIVHGDAFRTTSEMPNYQVFNLYGQQVLQGKISQRVDVSALPQGAYVLRVGAEQAKFVKQ